MWLREIKIVKNGCEQWDGCFLSGLKNHCIKCIYYRKKSLFIDYKLFEAGTLSNIGAKEERTFITAKF